MKLWIGTAGYSYPDWVGGFYPPGVPAAGRLAFYARHFPMVEVNSSFYRPPTPAQAERMCGQVPAGFGFSLKVPKSASHGFDPAELPAFRQAAETVAAHGTLLGLVAQFAESFKNLPASRDWVRRIRQELDPFPLAVEFRHASWDVPALPDWAGKHRLTVVGVGVPDLPQLFPDGPRCYGPEVYARLHGRNPSAWYAGGPARYDYDYPPEELDRWADALAVAAAGGAERAVIVFNNCVGTQAVANARTLAARMAGVPGVEVARPLMPAGAPGLFDGLG